MPSADHDTLARIRKLKQKPETWVVLRRKARFWVDPDEGESYRPYLVFVATPDGHFMKSTILDTPADTADVLDTVHQAMLRPLRFSGGARRPTKVQSDDAALVEALTPPLAALDVRCALGPVPSRLDQQATKIEHHMVKGPLPLGLMSVAGATHPRIRRLYELAAEYYSCAPWRFLTDAHPLAIHNPAEAEPRYGVVMGSGREVFGLAVYDSLRDLGLLYTAKGNRSIYRRMTWLALIFEVPRAMSCYDLDDLERYDWPVAGPSAYPMIGRTTRRGRLTVPDPDDITWLEGALAALVLHLKPARRRPPYPVEETLSVETLDGPRQVRLVTPAADSLVS